MAERPEGIEFRDDGTIAAVIEGQVHRLRRPKIREFRQLVEAARDIQDQVTVRAQELQAVLERIRAEQQTIDAEAEADDGDDLDEREARSADRGQRLGKLRVRDREESSQFSDWQDELWSGWLVDTFGLLADTPLADEGETLDDGLPVWLLSRDLPPKMIGHWRTVPSHSGPA